MEVRCSTALMTSGFMTFLSRSVNRRSRTIATMKTDDRSKGYIMMPPLWSKSTNSITPFVEIGVMQSQCNCESHLREVIR